MKKITLAIIILSGLLLASCSNTGYTTVTEWTKPSTTASPTTAQATDKIVKKKVVATDPVSKEDKKKSSKTSKSKTSKKSKKSSKSKTKETTYPATQGVVKSGRQIQITTIRGSLKASDFYFVYDSDTIKLGESIKKVENQIGETKDVAELSVKSNLYTYYGFKLTTLIDSNKKETVQKIEVTDKNWKTLKGAGFGYYGTALRKLYGNENTGNNQMIYSSGGKNLIFDVSNNLVTGITLRTDAIK